MILWFVSGNSWIIHGSYSVLQIEQHEMHNICLSNVTCSSFATWQNATTTSVLLLLAIFDYKWCDPIMLEEHYSLLVIFYSSNSCISFSKSILEIFLQWWTNTTYFLGVLFGNRRRCKKQPNTYFLSRWSRSSSYYPILWMSPHHTRWWKEQN